jgi:hypothetical protein
MRLTPLLILALLTLPLATVTAQIGGVEVYLARRVEVSRYGSIVMVENITLRGVEGGLPEVRLGYPADIARHVASLQLIEGEGYTPSLRVEGNQTWVILNPTGGPVGEEVDVKLLLVVKGVLKPKSGGRFTTNFTLVPRVEPWLNGTFILIRLPPKVELELGPLEFKRERVGDRVEWWANLTRAGPRYEELTLLAEGGDLHLINFPWAVREVVPLSQGGIVVRDTLRVVNQGNKSLDRLALRTLGGKEVRLLPVGDPPLLKPLSLTLGEDGTIPLTAISNRSLGPGEALTLRLEYPLGPEHYEAEATSYRLQIPQAPPVEGLVAHYTLRVGGAGFLIRGESRVVAANSTWLAPGALTVTVEPTPFWAVGEALPVATLLFTGALVALAWYWRPREEVAPTELAQALERLLKGYEDKLTTLEGILTPLAEQRVRGRRVPEALRELEETRHTLNRRLGELRAELERLGPEARPLLRRLTEAERRYDQALVDLARLVERLHAGRVSGTTYRRLSTRYRDRLGRAAAEVTATLDQLKREFEERV